jgi:hypothetical protein
MFRLSHTCLKFAGIGSLVALCALGTPAHADELPQVLGPVGPHEPILTTVANHRIIAFYVPGGGRCALHAVVGYDTGAVEAGYDTDADTDKSAARVRIILRPGQIVHLDSAEGESLNLRCGSDAQTLDVVDSDELVAFGITTQRPGHPVRADASSLH